MYMWHYESVENIHTGMAEYSKTAMSLTQMLQHQRLALSCGPAGDACQSAPLSQQLTGDC